MTSQNNFTKREIEIIGLLTQGKANKQIALELSISQRTVEYHITHILQKLNVSSRIEAVIKLSEDALRFSAGQTDEELRNSPGINPRKPSDNKGDSVTCWRVPMKKNLFIPAAFVILAALAVVVRVSINRNFKAKPIETQLPVSEKQPITSTFPPTPAPQTAMNTASARPTDTALTPAQTDNSAFFQGWPTVISPIFPDEDIYLAPLPLQFGAWPATAGCPNPDGLEDYASLLPEVAVDVLQHLSVGTREAEMQWTDPAYWPILINPFKDQQITLDWINEITRVSDSSYAGLITGQCGEEIMKLSWWVQVCPGPCQTYGTSQSLLNDVFMVARMQWLVWAIQ